MPTPQRFTLLRAVYKNFEDDAIPTRSAKGRFHTAVGSASYLAENSGTAWHEVSFRWQAEQNEYRLVQAELQVHSRLDLTDKRTQLKYGIDAAQLVADDHTYCQRLAERLRAKGIEAIRTYSRADQPDGRNWWRFSNV